MRVVSCYGRGIGAAAVAAYLCACNASGGSTASPALPLVNPATVAAPPQLEGRPTSSSKIKHVVIIVQENRSFNDLFYGYRGAKTYRYGYDTNGNKIKLLPIGLETTWDIDHSSSAFFAACNGTGSIPGTNCKMNGFNKEYVGCGSNCPIPHPQYAYVPRTETEPYFDMAQQYVLADHTFQTQGSGSFTAHQDLIAGGTDLSSTEALIDTPSYFPWGCDGNPQHLVTAVIKRGGKVYEYGGPFPCLTYSTLRDLLDAKSVSWKFYAVRVYPYTNCPKCQGAGIWSAFDAIKAVRYSSEWKDNVTRSPSDIFTDISNKSLPAVAWITPNGPDSDHPASGSDTGPSWVASIVNAVGKSSYWDSTAVVILWDDWGGFYDHVAPPEPRNWQGGPGFRVPMLIVSPYVKPHVEHTQYEFGSILRFIEDNWSLGTLGKNDADSRSIGNAFDFDMKPRAFKVIPSKYPSVFFLHRPPSDVPLDTE